MRPVAWVLTLFAAASISSAALVAPPEVQAHTCACLDGNGDDACGNVADTPIDDNDWLKGPAVGLGGNFAGSTFVVPAGCNHTVTTAPSGGIRVIADRLVFDGTLISTPNGGEGVLFRIANDIVLSTGADIESGGINKLPNTLANAGVAKASVGLQAGGSCTITGTLRGRPETGSGQVGIGCQGDIDIHGATIVAAGVDIQSIGGAIDGSCSAGGGGGGGGACPANGAGLACDNPAINPNGNNNGVLDAGDFPCNITFNSVDDVCDFCGPPPQACNFIDAVNNPLVMIAKGNLDLGGATPAAENIIEGRFLINLVSEDGNVNLNNALVTNLISGTPSGGARIFVFANPASVTRAPVLKEKSFGPSTGTISIDGTCFRSSNKVHIGEDDGDPNPPFLQLLGTPDPPSCAQNPADFMEVMDGP